jgi:hypothetical protein
LHVDSNSISAPALLRASSGRWLSLDRYTERLLLRLSVTIDSGREVYVGMIQYGAEQASIVRDQGEEAVELVDGAG